jgi:Kef-type K+ transport system membrane component KefB
MLQVLADRGETGSRHGRAAFSILLFQVPSCMHLGSLGFIWVATCSQDVWIGRKKRISHNSTARLQDLAVVVLLMLIPLLAPKEGAAIGFATISKALGSVTHADTC